MYTGFRLRLHVVRNQRISTKSSHDIGSPFTLICWVPDRFGFALADPSGYDSHNRGAYDVTVFDDILGGGMVI